MSVSRLQTLTKDQLLNLARKRGVARARDLSKDQLLKALVRSRSVQARPAAKSAPRGAKMLRPAARPARAAAPRKPLTKAALKSSVRQKSAAHTLTEEKSGLADFSPVGSSRFHPLPSAKHAPTKQLPELPKSYGRDRIVALVRDPYWLHCYWELSPAGVERAEAALGADWHGAKPVLRLVDITSEETTSSAEAIVRDIDIHAGTNNWYIDVPNPPRSYRVDLGFLARSGRFYVSARSNIVTTPKPGISDKIDENWADVQEKFEKLYSVSAGFEQSGSSADIKKMFEERLKRPLTSPTVPGLGSGGMVFAGPKGRKFWFHLDAELIVYGATEPTAKVNIRDEQVQLRPDGTFTLRYSLPDSRQIIPAVARSADGVEERTIVLAIERNTKALEPMIIENGDI
jgi:hypothetical protein